MHRRRVILEMLDAGEDQPRCLALWMRTRHLISWSEALQMPLDFVHHLVGFGVLKHPSQVRLALIAETENA